MRFPMGKLLLTVLAVVIACSSVVSAQVWQPFQFSVAERYEYRITSHERGWNSYWDSDAGEWIEEATVHITEQFYGLEVRPTGTVNADGNAMFDVTTTNRLSMATGELSEVVLWGGLMDAGTFVFGNPFELMFVLSGLQDIEMQIGERTNLFGFGRIIVTDEITVGDRDAVIVAYEQGEAGNRKKMAEWIIDATLPMPVGVRTFDDDGQLHQETLLVKYERL